MNFDDLTIGQAKQLAQMFCAAEQDKDTVWQIGTAYLVRCVTHYTIGILERVTRQELLFTDAGWCADTGRYEKALRTGVVEEFEPAPDGTVIVGRGAVVDAYVWAHDPPRQVVG